jgi:hypothetical protein
MPPFVLLGGLLLLVMSVTTGGDVGRLLSDALAPPNTFAGFLFTVFSPLAMTIPAYALLLQIARRPSVGRLWRALMVLAFLLLAAVDGVRMWHDTGVPVGFNAVIAVAGIWCLFRRPARRYFAQ